MLSLLGVKLFLPGTAEGLTDRVEVAVSKLVVDPFPLKVEH